MFQVRPFPDKLPAGSILSGSVWQPKQEVGLCKHHSLALLPPLATDIIRQFGLDGGGVVQHCTDGAFGQMPSCTCLTQP
jgi:hypothetical protein